MACKVIKFLQGLVTYASTYVLVALSIDRYDAITHPMNFSGSCKFIPVRLWSCRITILDSSITVRAKSKAPGTFCLGIECNFLYSAFRALRGNAYTRYVNISFNICLGIFCKMLIASFYEFMNLWYLFMENSLTWKSHFRNTSKSSRKFNRH